MAVARSLTEIPITQALSLLTPHSSFLIPFSNHFKKKNILFRKIIFVSFLTHLNPTVAMAVQTQTRTNEKNPEMDRHSSAMFDRYCSGRCINSCR